MEVQYDGETCTVSDELVRVAEQAYFLWRDGLGRLIGPLGRQAFLRATSEIGLRFASGDAAYILTKALRSKLARRKRSKHNPPLRTKQMELFEGGRDEQV